MIHLLIGVGCLLPVASLVSGSGTHHPVTLSVHAQHQSMGVRVDSPLVQDKVCLVALDCIDHCMAAALLPTIAVFCSERPSWSARSQAHIWRDNVEELVTPPPEHSRVSTLNL